MTSVFEPLITLGRKPLETEDVPYIVKTINEAGDASAAIVGGIFVEDALTEAIFSRLIVLTPKRKQELTRQNGPLSTFDSKITVSRALGGRPAARHRALRGRPHGARLSVAPAALLRERRAGGLRGAASDDAAELRRPAVVVRLPARAAPRGEALPAAGRQAVREPRRPRVDVCVLPGEREPAHRRHRRGRKRQRTTSSQGDAQHGLPRRAAAGRWAHHGGAVVGTSWAARIKLNGRTTAGERSFVHSSITGRNMRLVISKARRQMCWATMDV